MIICIITAYSKAVIVVFITIVSLTLRIRVELIIPQVLSGTTRNNPPRGLPTRRRLGSSFSNRNIHPTGTILRKVPLLLTNKTLAL